MTNMNRTLAFLLFLLAFYADGDPRKGKKRALKVQARSNRYEEVFQQSPPPPPPPSSSPPPPPLVPTLESAPSHTSTDSGNWYGDEARSRNAGKGGKGGPSERASKSGKGKGKGGGNQSGDDDIPTGSPGHEGLDVTLKITNLTFRQPFSSFLVVLHNRDADPLFVFGEEASQELAMLAEDGNPGPLYDKYNGAFGVKFVDVHDAGAPFFGGQVTYITVPYERSYPYITIASMAINTNDCFVALNSVFLSPGQIIDVPGYDAGSEVNNELCSSIPGPACPSGSGNVRSGNGEGYVHIHRGFKGVGDRLSEAGYDWRNPMMRVEVIM
jgi:hypothetical protein